MRCLFFFEKTEPGSVFLDRNAFEFYFYSNYILQLNHFKIGGREMSNPNNNVNLIGHIISEPQFLHTRQNVEFATRFLLSVKKGYKNSEGKELRDVVPVRIRGEKRMSFAHMLKKGDHICLNGVITSESYLSKEGTKMFSLCVEALNVNWTYGNTTTETKEKHVSLDNSKANEELNSIEFEFDFSELPFH